MKRKLMYTHTSTINKEIIFSDNYYPRVLVLRKIMEKWIVRLLSPFPSVWNESMFAWKQLLHVFIDCMISYITHLKQNNEYLSNYIVKKGILNIVYPVPVTLHQYCQSSPRCWRGQSFADSPLVAREVISIFLSSSLILSILRIYKRIYP